MHKLQNLCLLSLSPSAFCWLIEKIIFSFVNFALLARHLHFLYVSAWQKTRLTIQISISVKMYSWQSLNHIVNETQHKYGFRLDSKLLAIVNVSKSQKAFFFEIPFLKKERNIWQNSALASWGRILSNVCISD